MSYGNLSALAKGKESFKSKPDAELAEANERKLSDKLEWRKESMTKDLIQHLEHEYKASLESAVSIGGIVEKIDHIQKLLVRAKTLKEILDYVN